VFPYAQRSYLASGSGGGTFITVTATNDITSIIIITITTIIVIACIQYLNQWCH